ncbi:transcriptional regulator [Microbacterium sp. Y-01]|uniref:helix-turn-helix domain-containing protein n=1 Tax=Microbacterium sp. Y-01 TaxID=2048898 RepID=UPI000F5D879C|nr:helix-turn-helix transcriptional regulator [Microbacterium sp. Y-01]AZH77005.1 transcriptional regulator [Microbacterium sp. Y-01]
MNASSLNLGHYLRARRAVVQPEEVGLDRQTGRRVPGLRRREVAELAGISAEYYLRIEQGRVPRPSEQVLTALAGALRLGATSFAYMMQISSDRPFAPSEPPADSADRITRTLGRWTHTPAYISDPYRDIVASNPLATVFGLGGLSVGGNQVINLFNARMKRTLVEWEEMTRSAVATLRRDAHPDAPRLREIVDELSSDPDFSRIWARHDVSGPEDALFRVDIDGVGTIPVDAQNFAIRSIQGYQLTVLSAPSGTITESVFASLAAGLPGGAPSSLAGAEQ